jgi:hypothetical protein
LAKALQILKACAMRSVDNFELPLLEQHPKLSNKRPEREERAYDHGNSESGPAATECCEYNSRYKACDIENDVYKYKLISGSRGINAKRTYTNVPSSEGPVELPPKRLVSGPQILAEMRHLWTDIAHNS